MTGFLNSPIANSSHPDANPAAQSPNIEVLTTPPPSIMEIRARCRVDGEGDILSISEFSSALHPNAFIVQFVDEHSPRLSAGAAILTIADLEKLAKNMLAFAAQKKAKRSLSSETDAQAEADFWAEYGTAVPRIGEES